VELFQHKGEGEVITEKVRSPGKNEREMARVHTIFRRSKPLSKEAEKEKNSKKKKKKNGSIGGIRGQIGRRGKGLSTLADGSHHMGEGGVKRLVTWKEGKA